jgi:hypothetical protein
VNFEYCPSADMIADVLTKSLARNVHRELVAKFGLKYSEVSSVSGSVEAY